MMTRDERNEYQRNRRKENGNAYTLKYERTKKGKIMRIYRNMLSRITGVQQAKHHLYKGKSLVGKEFFYRWAMGCPEFHALFDCWVASGFDRKYAPSVDRVDSSQGYSVSNMEWVTHSENSRRGAISQRLNGQCKLGIAA